MKKLLLLHTKISVCPAVAFYSNLSCKNQKRENINAEERPDSQVLIPRSETLPTAPDIRPPTQALNTRPDPLSSSVPLKGARLPGMTWDSSSNRAIANTAVLMALGIPRRWLSGKVPGSGRKFWILVPSWHSCPRRPMCTVCPEPAAFPVARPLHPQYWPHTPTQTLPLSAQ